MIGGVRPGIPFSTRPSGPGGKVGTQSSFFGTFGGRYVALTACGQEFLRPKLDIGTVNGMKFDWLSILTTWVATTRCWIFPWVQKGCGVYARISGIHVQPVSKENRVCVANLCSPAYIVMFVREQKNRLLKVHSRHRRSQLKHSTLAFSRSHTAESY